MRAAQAGRRTGRFAAGVLSEAAPCRARVFLSDTRTGLVEAVR